MSQYCRGGWCRNLWGQIMVFDECVIMGVLMSSCFWWLEVLVGSEERVPGAVLAGAVHNTRTVWMHRLEARNNLNFGVSVRFLKQQIRVFQSSEGK